MLDTHAIRDRFPALSRRENGKPVLHFDNPAGTQVPKEAIEGFNSYLRLHNANVGGFFPASRATDEIIAEARAAMADFLGASDPREIVFYDRDMHSAPLGTSEI